MSKKKPEEELEQETSSQEEQVDETSLTEWQKRNLEFLAKKKQEEADKEQKQKEERLEKLALYGKLPKEEVEQDDEPEKESKKQKKAKSKQPKVKKVKVKRQASKRQKALLRALPLLIGTVLILLFSLFVISPYSRQKDVKVVGSEHTNASDIITQANIQPSDYIFSLLLDAKRYETKLAENNPWVEKAQLTYQFPNTFTMKVDEYEILGYIQVASGFQPVLSSGKKGTVLGASELPNTYLTINVSNDGQLKTLVQGLKSIPKKLRRNIESIALAEPQTTTHLLVLTMRDGNTVRVPLSELAEKLPYYDKVKTSVVAPAIIDMEVGIYSTTADIEASSSSSSSSSQAKDDNKSSHSETASSEGTEATSETVTETNQEANTDVVSPPESSETETVNQ